MEKCSSFHLKNITFIVVLLQWPPCILNYFCLPNTSQDQLQLTLSSLLSIGVWENKQVYAPYGQNQTFLPVYAPSFVLNTFQPLSSWFFSECRIQIVKGKTIQFTVLFGSSILAHVVLNLKYQLLPPFTSNF